MSIKSVNQFPIFAPPPQPRRPATEIRFSRWNNANAEKFVRPKRAQKEIEDQIRIQKRFDSALSIAHNYNPAPPHPTIFKSTGTPSAPSAPSIPGRSSKYSKSPTYRQHPAFEALSEVKPRKFPVKEKESQVPAGPNFRIDDNGVSYEMPDAPFLYQYSYTETPKMKPVKLREPLISPFGPETMAKPWMGRKPLPPSKKKLPEFDSFQLPPRNKKGVKSVQAPGPFLAGSGPKYVRSREEILGEPLTKEEVDFLIQGCKKSDRQLNIGRDGLTHNMLDNIHAHWKRRRVCKIKCKGVCTVDMSNVCQQLEEKTGGKIIYNRGGVIYLFRGRNYNYKSRPRFPLMLWKPVSPVYPRLIQHVPEGLTKEEAIEMREKGRDLLPICKIAKNGVYCDLIKNVREAFEACELVRINCQGLNASDYRKIGAKLRDLVPCVLISFQYEHILIWRGRDWVSSLTESKESPNGSEGVKVDDIMEAQVSPFPKELEEVKDDDIMIMEAQKLSSSSVSSEGIIGAKTYYSDSISSSTCGNGESVENSDSSDDIKETEISAACEALHGNLISVSGLISAADNLKESEESTACTTLNRNLSEPFNPSFQMVENAECSETMLEFDPLVDQPKNELEARTDDLSILPWIEGVLLLREKAVNNGIAMVLDTHSLDSDTVFRKTSAFAKDAPAEPVFRRRARQVPDEVVKRQELDDSSVKVVPSAPRSDIAVARWRGGRKSSTSEKMKSSKGKSFNVVPDGNLRIDELAKLLA